MLISPVLPIMTLYRLPHGQYSYSGHIINLPQDVTSFANSLPRLPNELDMIVVRKQGSTETHHDFRVKRSVILCALQWLIANNIYFHNISINYEALTLLPEDATISDLCTMTITSDESEPSAQPDIDLHSTPMQSSFVPVPTRGLTQQQTIRQSVNQQPSSTQATQPILPWPSISNIPINEFNTEGYISCAFPTLFPSGSADLLAPRARRVTIGNYFKHLMMYQDGRFARHPRFRYFALNTVLRWRAIQTGRIYVRQHPHDQHLTIDELRDMVGRESETLSNRVLHFATSLRGTRQYWFKQRTQLIAMVDTLGLPTVFFTHSAADLHWPELAHLICPSDADNRSQAVIENPALADWFFYHRISTFIKSFYKDVLGATDYWLRFEWQHRGSPHVHGVAWLTNAPHMHTVNTSCQPSLNNTTDTTTHDTNVLVNHDDMLRDLIDQSSSSTDSDYSETSDSNQSDRDVTSRIETTQEDVLTYVNRVVSTINPALLPDGSDIANAPPPKTNPHICSVPYTQIIDYHQDLNDLIATCQRHTRCSSAYCLRTKNGIQTCCFGYPKPLQPHTVIVTGEDGEPEILTAHNDGLINSYNPVQLSAWRANVDMQYCISRCKVIEYVAKYATKTEPRSIPLKDIYANIIRNLNETDTSLKVVHKLLINSIGERDYSSQETCHLLLQLPLTISSREYTILSLDGSRQIQTQPQHSANNTHVTISSTLDHYITRPTTPLFQHMKLLHFAQSYNMPHRNTSEPTKRRKKNIVIVRPYYSHDPNGPNFEQYCSQKLMLHKPFHHLDELKGDFSSFAEAYHAFLQSATVPPSLEEDIARLQQLHQQMDNDDDNNEVMIAYNINTITLYVNYFIIILYRNYFQMVICHVILLMNGC